MSTLKELRDRKHLIENFLRSNNVLKTVTLVKLNKYKQLVKVAEAINDMIPRYIFESAVVNSVQLNILNLVLGCDEGMCATFYKRIKSYLNLLANRTDETVMVLGKKFIEQFGSLPHFDCRPMIMNEAQIYNFSMELCDYIESHNLTTFIIHYMHKNKIVQQKVVIYRNASCKISLNKRLYIYTVIHGAMVNSIYSENTERLLALENANTNSKDMLKKINLSFNRLRQEKITNSLNEIVTGVFI